MRSWASRSGTPPRRATATATRTSRPAGRPSWTPSYSRSDRASTPGASWASRGAEKPNEHAAASRQTSGLPPGSRRRSRSSWTTRSGAALAGHLTQSRCSSQGESVSTPLRRAPAWDELRACRPGERLTLASARPSDSTASPSQSVRTTSKRLVRKTHRRTNVAQPRADVSRGGGAGGPSLCPSPGPEPSVPGGARDARAADRRCSLRARLRG